MPDIKFYSNITVPGLLQNGHAVINENDIDAILTQKDVVNHTSLEQKLLEKGYITDTDVETKLTTKGYVKESEIDTKLTTKGYVKDSDVDSKLSSKRYISEDDVEQKVSEKGYVKNTEVPNIPTPWSNVSNKPNTLLGYGIIDAQSLDSDLSAIAGLSSTGISARVSNGSWVIRTITGTSGNIVVTNGDCVSGNPTINLVSTGITAGTYQAITVDSYGRVISGSNPTTLSGYGITDAQTINSILTSISGLSTNTVGTIKLNNGVASLDQASYLTSNQSISISGDAIGTGTTNISLTLSNTGVTAGTYNNYDTITPFTVDSKGRITALGNPVSISPSWNNISGKPTTISGYGITDAQPINSNLNSISSLQTTTSGFIKLNNGVASIDVNNYLLNNQSITISGDASGTGSTSIVLTLANSGVTAGTYHSVTVNDKGLVISGSDSSNQIITGSFASSTGTTIIPADTTTPLSTEGSQIWSANITPSTTSSKVSISTQFTLDSGQSSRTITVALFRGTTCIQAYAIYFSSTVQPRSTSVQFVDSPSTTASTTYSMRVGISAAGSWYINQNSSGRITYGGVNKSTYILQEI